jgi:amino acid adenylation domain-containing protein
MSVRQKSLARVVADRARSYPDLPVLPGSSVTFERLEQTAAALRTAVPAFAQAPDDAVLAAAAALAPDESARLSSALGETIRSSAVAGGTVVATLRRLADARPDHVAVREGEVELTYAQLWDRASDSAERLRANGTGPGSIVGAPTVETIDAAIEVVACALCGATLAFGTGELPPRRPDLTALLVVRRLDTWFVFDDDAIVQGCRATWSVPSGQGPVLWWHMSDAAWGPVEFWGPLLLGVGLTAVDHTVTPAEQVRRDGLGPVAATVHQLPALKGVPAVVVDAQLPVEDGRRSVTFSEGTFGALDAGHGVVLDARLRRVPPGVIGHLYSTGESAARMSADPRATAGRSVAAPVATGAGPGEMMVWTGVSASTAVDGSVTVRGRLAGAAVVRGVRVDLEGMAARLRDADGVIDAHVVVLSDPNAGPRVIAHVHTEDPRPPAVVRRALLDTLPDHAAPAALVLVPVMPVGRDGRVDETVLPAVGITAARSFADGGDVRGATIDLVQSVFADVLGTTTVGYDQSLFDLGGSSLTAARVVARVNAARSGQLRVVDVFDAPTPRGLSRLLDDAARGEGDAEIVRLAAVANTPRPTRLPVAPAQIRLWILARLDPSSTAYTVPLVLRLTGELDLDALTDALVDITSRHDSLRSTFPEDDDGPYLSIASVSSMRGRRPPVIDVELDTVSEEVTSLVSRPFDVTSEIPYRAAILRVSETVHVLVVCLHHLVVDGASLTPLVTDLVTAYAARARGMEPGWSSEAPSYADYARWQVALLGSAEHPTARAASQLRYWDAELDGLPASLDLPVDRAEGTLSARAGDVELDVSVSLHQEIDAYARRHGVSEHMVLLAAYAVGVARWSGGEDFAIGVAVAGRNDPALDAAVGMFVGTVAVRVRVSPSSTFADVVRRVRDASLSAYDSSDVPFEWIAARLARDGAPLYRIGFAYGAPASTVSIALPGLQVDTVDAGLGAPKDDLLFTATSSVDSAGIPSGITLSMIYSTALFDESTVRSALSVVEAVLSSGVSDRACPVGDLDVLGDAERARLMSALRGPEPADHPTLLPDLLFGAAAAFADSTAVVCRTDSMTYRELGARASRLARTLIAAGAGPGVVVALSFPRSLDMVVAVWAVAATGAAYLPLDAAYPPARTAYMANDAGASIGLARRSTIGSLPDTVAWTAIDDEWALPVDADPRCRPVAPSERPGLLRIDSAAYVIYTSGSTGAPKGVVVTHAGISGLAEEARRRFATGPESRPAQTASPSFDPYLLDMLVFTLGGATLVVVPPEIVAGDEMTEYLAEQRVTHLSTTPGVVSTLDPLRLPTVQMMSVGGEALAPTLRDTWAPSVRMVGAYGPTEATVASHFSDPLRVGEVVTLGRAVTGSGALVLDSRLHPVPLGSVGELYLYGEGLARGYHGRSAFTATRFVAGGYAGAGTRMYRTGDLVRAVAAIDGEMPTLRYVGRVDTQIKVRGIRVEPQEVDAVLLQMFAVEAAVTVGRRTPGGETMLVTYYVDGEVTQDPEELRTRLAAELPPASVPAVLVPLPALPLTTNGKVDTGSLPVPEVNAPSPPRPPRGETEHAVLAVFAAVTGIDGLGVDDDFFRSGGDSLSATRVVSRLGREIGRRVPVRALFDAPTAARLAAYLDSVGEEPGTAPPMLGSIPRPARIALSYAQTRMWFANRFDVVTTGQSDAESARPATAYNVPLVTRVTGDLDVDALAAAVDDVVMRHESLRTRYPDSDDGPYQEILPASALHLDLTPLSVSDHELAGEVARFVGTRFDVTAAPPLATRLWRREDGSHMFALVVHHVALDGESMRPLVRDLLQAYSSRAKGESPRFPDLPVQYADFAVWQRASLGDPETSSSRAAEHLGYWRSALDGIPEGPILPADFPRPPVPSLRAETVPMHLDADIHRAVIDMAAATGSTPFMVVHAALSVFLARWARIDDVVIGTPVAGRGDEMLDEVVGMFVGTVALRTRIDGAASFVDVVDRVRDGDLAAFHHAELPFERVVDALARVGSTSHHPIFQIMLSYQNIERPVARVAGIGFEPLDVDPGTSQYDLHLVVSEEFESDGSATGMPAALTFATDVFDARTARAWTDTFPMLLRALLTRPERPVGDAPMTTESQTAELLAAGDRAPLPARTLSDLLSDSYREHGDLVAVEDGTRSLTYRELGELVRERRDVLVASGVGPESVVAVSTERSIESVIDVQAVVSAGAAYVPVDPDWPAERRDFVLASAGTATDTRAVPRPSSPAYVLFTSGSTGEPKGVVVTHAAVVGQLQWLQSIVPADPSGAILWRSRMTFDLSVWELWWPMLGGARLVVAPPDCDRDPAVLADTVRRHRVTALTFVPSLLESFLAFDRSGAADALATVRDILCIGESLPRTLVSSLAAASRTSDGTAPTVHNLYGPTEAAVSVTHHRVRSSAQRRRSSSIPE